MSSLPPNRGGRVPTVVMAAMCVFTDRLETAVSPGGSRRRIYLNLQSCVGALR